jgi:Kef-type K+ transport system membrane component KefB
MMYSDALLTLGILFSVGLLADQIGHRTRIPRVTLLLVCGLGAGAFDLLPDQFSALTDIVMVAALTLVAFLLGGSLQPKTLRTHGLAILTISIAIVSLTLGIVTVGLWLLGVELALALILASIATATAPAATLDVLKQVGHSNGFTCTLEGIVAIDDVWGLLTFSLCLTLASSIAISDGQAGFSALYEIGGAIVLGGLIGLPATYLSGRIKAGEPLQIEALAISFLTAGLAVTLDVSFLISGIVVGALIASLAQHHRRAFHEIEHIKLPFMIVFFILAGASLDLSSVKELGFVGLALVALRVIARLLGGWVGASLAREPKPLRHLYGPALLPQAGVSIGMALIAGLTFPQWKDQIMALIVGTTVVFELFGPFCTMWAVRKSAPIQCSDAPAQRLHKGA